ncbi:MAG: RluA family pseudouridine synthase, partial [Flammeovirgaceae bacterium]|nr:RluA family pseudouridine synthase [Flammeovirgaceae bacterium]
MKPIKFEELIVFENEHYVIVNKPAGIASLDERDTTRNNLLAMAKAYHPSNQLCHRLDKETSGVIAIAKHPEAYRNLSLQFENREVVKIYHAIVNGIHHFQEEMVDLPIAISSKGNARIDMQEGKPSLTVFNTIRVFGSHTLVACFPLTGRMHQIRLHLSVLKAPITADLLYGGKYTYLSDLKKKFKLKKDTEEEPLIKRVALHAYSLKFQDLTGEAIQVEAP